MTTGWEDIPRLLNLASWFVDRNVEEGRGDRTALIGPGGPTTYAELARLTNQAGNLLRELGVRAEERVLLVLNDSVEFVALWYGAQKIGAVTAEAYTFLQPKDYAYYLDYTRARVVVVDEQTEGPIREVAGSQEVLVAREGFLEGMPDELERPRPRRTTSRSGSSRRARPGSRRRPSIPRTAPSSAASGTRRTYSASARTT